MKIADGSMATLPEPKNVQGGHGKYITPNSGLLWCTMERYWRIKTVSPTMTNSILTWAFQEQGSSMKAPWNNTNMKQEVADPKSLLIMSSKFPEQHWEGGGGVIALDSPTGEGLAQGICQAVASAASKLGEGGRICLVLEALSSLILWHSLSQVPLPYPSFAPEKSTICFCFMEKSTPST